MSVRGYQGFLARTVRMLEKGVKPLFVFDGEPPTLKARLLCERKQRKADALAEHGAAVAAGADKQEVKAVVR